MRFGNSYLGILLGVALLCTVVLGSCSYVAGQCEQAGGNWNGDNLSCTHQEKK